MAETSSPVLFETIKTASGHSFGRATLNAPASLNALSLPMVDLLAPQLTAWANDASIAGVVLDAVGDKAFCAGGDVVGLYHAIRATPEGQVPQAPVDFFEREYRLDHQIHTYPKPFVCWGHGIVMGGGIGLMAGASHRVATAKTRMAMPEINIGLYPDVGGTWLLPRLPGRTGLFLALTAASINAADALHAKLADVAVPHEKHGEFLQALASASWLGDRRIDDMQLTRLLLSLGNGMALPTSPLAAHQARIDEILAGDDLAAMAPRLAALASDPDPWLAQAGGTFLKGSPTSAALSHELLKRSSKLSLADAFRLELQASIGCCVHHDFPEGVRALLVDKDRNPQWQPATLAEVTPAFIEDHLRARFDGAHPLADLG